MRHILLLPLLIALLAVGGTDRTAHAADPEPGPETGPQQGRTAGDLVLTGADLPAWTGEDAVHVDRLAAYRYDGESLVRIDLRVHLAPDEETGAQSADSSAEEDACSEDDEIALRELRAEDELVMSTADAGERAPDGTVPAGASDPHEVALTDAHPKRTHLYLALTDDEATSTAADDGDEAEPGGTCITDERRPEEDEDEDPASATVTRMSESDEGEDGAEGSADGDDGSTGGEDTGSGDSEAHEDGPPEHGAPEDEQGERGQGDPHDEHGDPQDGQGDPQDEPQPQEKQDDAQDEPQRQETQDEQREPQEPRPTERPADAEADAETDAPREAERPAPPRSADRLAPAGEHMPAPARARTAGSSSQRSLGAETPTAASRSATRRIEISGRDRADEDDPTKPEEPEGEVELVAATLPSDEASRTSTSGTTGRDREAPTASPAPPPPSEPLQVQAAGPLTLAVAALGGSAAAALLLALGLLAGLVGLVRRGRPALRG